MIEEIQKDILKAMEVEENFFKIIRPIVESEVRNQLDSRFETMEKQVGALFARSEAIKIYSEHVEERVHQLEGKKDGQTTEL